MESKNTLTDSPESPRLANGMSEDCFNRLSDSQKETVLANTGNLQSKERDAGLVGKILGANKDNAAVNSASLVCVILIVICLCCSIVCIFRGDNSHLELWKIVIPVVTLALGYVFGRG